MDCEGCERKVKKAVEGMKGVAKVEVEPKQHKLTVTGYVDPNKVLQRVRHRTGKKADFWPYVQYDLVARLTRKPHLIIMYLLLVAAQFRPC
ncbi:hypothetical protein P3X46_015855 [Hevea brasiliensis]|uniref:HMA domain-containing protein n=2 Tax=Hevea brasiliensis TaxID=3981 RepID=A0ABQ9M177_HEVBR|nr:hypothetical protein P3X46_015855 [Hevea brasiliensis]